MPNFSIQIVLLLISGFLNFIIGLIVIIRKLNQKNIFFSVMVFGFSFWAFSSIFSDWCLYILLNPNQLFFWAKISVVGPLISVYFFWLLALHICKKRVSIKIFILSMLPLLFLLILVPTNLNIRNIYYSNILGYYQTNIGFLYNLFFLYGLLYGSSAFVLLIKEFNKSKGIIKAQIKYIILSMSILFVIGLFFNVLLPLLNYDNLIIYGPFSTFIFSIIIAYAITRYRLLDIRIMIKKSFVIFSIYICLIFLVICIGYCIQLFLEHKLGLSYSTSIIIIVTLLIFIIQFIQDKVKKILSIISKRDYIDLSKKFDEYYNFSFTPRYSLNKFCADLHLELKNKIKLKKVNFLLLNDRNIYSSYYPQKDIANFDYKNQLILLIKKYPKIILIDELKYFKDNNFEDNIITNFLSHKELDLLLDKMNTLHYSIILPLNNNDSLLGFIGIELCENYVLTKEQIDYFIYIQNQSSIIIYQLQRYEKIINQFYTKPNFDN